MQTNKQTQGMNRAVDGWLLHFILTVFPVGLLGALILQSTRQHFTYTLDDPYIHLALARNVALGHYGINSGEFSAPSSSILWPFLLAPFARLSCFEYIPLAINIGCLGGLVYGLNQLCVAKPFWLRILLIGITLFSLNAYGLVFSGMEHSLQLWLVSSVACAIVAYRHDTQQANHTTVPTVIYGIIVLLPLVRYENLAIALPVLAYLFFKDNRQKALITLLALLSGVLGFSVFLWHLQLGFLPSSVLAKSSHATSGAIVENVVKNIDQYGFMLLPVAWVCQQYWRTDRALAVVILVSTALHFTLGKFGWFGRYEPYWLLFILIFCYDNLKHSISAGFINVLPLLMMPLAFWSLIFCTVKTPLATAYIYSMQAQTAKITQLLGESVAVNDLGLVALKSQHYVLDLYGLGNLEALTLRQAHTDTLWAEALMQKKAVKYAFVFDQWFAGKPASWLKVAELKLMTQGTLIPWDTVSFYAVDGPSKLKLTGVMKEFMRINHSDQFSITLF